MIALRPHPRLLASSANLHRLKEKVTLPLLRRAARNVAEKADGYVRSSELAYESRLHNALLLRAREMQCRIITLLVRWRQTGGELFRQAALADVWTMGAWTYWSWGCEKEANGDPEADFDLSYGENSATLALAYDWLFSTLSQEERKRFCEIALRWSIRPFLAQTEKSKRAWWFGKANSNWNTVCAGGAGLLALAFHEEFPDAAAVIRRAEESIAPYMKALEATGGGWIEGIGYWNYGHRYAFWYLLSHERAAGRKHPLLRQRGTRQTLDFPLDFCPRGQPCSFGDVNLWSPLPFHYAAAMRLRRTDLIPQLDKLYSGGSPEADGLWPNAAELLLFHPRTTMKVRAPRRAVQKLYPELEWGILADQLPDSHFYLSVRGGAAGWEVPHTQLDLLSFHCVVGGERLIDNPGIDGGREYLDTTFSNRRFDLFETTPASKNTLLLNGVGINNPARAVTTALGGRGWKGLRLDVTSSLHWIDPSAVVFCGRLFLLLDGPLALIIDRVDLKHPGRVEARFHSFSRVECTDEQAVIHGRRERLRMAWAATVPTSLHEARAALTNPFRQANVLRWCTQERVHTHVAFATLLSPGQAAAKVEIEDTGRHLAVRVQKRKTIQRLQISRDLRGVTRKS